MRRLLLALIPLALLAVLLVVIVQWGPADAVRGEDYPPVERITFQRLTLESGTHTIEVRAPGVPPMTFDVNIQPGQTLNLHVR